MLFMLRMICKFYIIFSVSYVELHFSLGLQFFLMVRGCNRQLRALNASQIFSVGDKP